MTSPVPTPAAPAAAMPLTNSQLSSVTASISLPSPRQPPALRLVSTKDMDRETWLEVRRQGIGSSDAAAAVGLNPYQSQLELWMHKVGKGHLLPTIDPNDATSPMYWGTLLEPIVAAHYTKRTGNRVRRINAVLRHPKVPWMLANIDREVIGSDSVQILECKTAGLNGARLWKDGVPEYIQLQVMHQLAVTGKQAADVAVLICGQELQVHRIERDEAMIAQLIALEAQFWEWVTFKQEPPADASESAATALRSLYAYDQGDAIDLSEDNAASGAFIQLQQVRQQLSDCETKEAQLKHQIQQRMGTASTAQFAEGSVSWRRSKDSQVFNAALFQQEHPELAKSYQGSKPGSRRFLLHADPRT